MRSEARRARRQVALTALGALAALLAAFLLARWRADGGAHAPGGAAALEASTAPSAPLAPEPPRAHEHPTVPLAPEGRTGATSLMASVAGEPLAEEPSGAAGELALEVLVLDADDEPVEDAALFVAALDGAWNLAGRTGADGLATLRVAASGASAELALAVGASGISAADGAEALRHQAIGSAAPRVAGRGRSARASETLEAATEPLPDVPLRRVTLHTGKLERVALGVRGATPSAAPTPSADREARSARDRAPVPPPEPARPEDSKARDAAIPHSGAAPKHVAACGEDEEGRLFLRDPAHPTPAVAARGAPESLLPQGRRAASTASPSQTSGVRVAGTQAIHRYGDAMLVGLMNDEDGRPAAGVRVRARFLSDEREGRPAARGGEPGAARAFGRAIHERWTHTQLDGSYVLMGVRPGRIELRAGGGEHGVAETVLRAFPGETLAFDATLDRGLELRGTLLGQCGEPLAGWTVEIERESRDLLRWDRARTDEEGRYALPNLPPGGLRLLCLPPGENACLPALLLEPVFAGRGEQVLHVHDSELPRGSLEIEVVVRRSAGEAPAPELRLFHLDSGRGLWLVGPEPRPAPSDRIGNLRRFEVVGAPPIATRLHRAAHLPAGRYELCILAPGSRPVRIGPFGLAPSQHLNLGRIALEEPGSLRVERAGAPAKHESWDWRILRRGSPLTIELAAGRGALPLDCSLPAGDFELELTREGRTLELPFTVKSQGETLLDIGD